MDILQELADYAKLRVKKAKEEISLEEIKEKALSLPKGNFPFIKALQKDEISFICECKKASPSKGIIAKDFPYLEIAKAYAEGGADAISVLTEPKWFLGNNEFLREIAKIVKVPVLRKDFTVDPYMIYEAKVLGASAILLICKILSDKELKEFHNIAEDLGLNAIVEAHDEEEIQRAIACGAKIIGVNNRNLTDFSVDTSNSAKLRKKVPKDILFIAESGIKTKDDVDVAQAIGANAVLIGETLMRSKNIKETLAMLGGK